MRILNCLGLILLLSPNVLHASEVDVPNSFSAGTAAVADDVNENFSAIETAVDDNHQLIVDLQARIEALENALPTAVAMPTFPWATEGSNFVDIQLDGTKAVLTVRFNIAMDPSSFVLGDNVTVTGAGGNGTGTMSWSHGNRQLIFTTVEDFTTLSPCFSGGLEYTIMGDGDNPVLDNQGNPLDGDRNGLPGGDFQITYDIVC
ncbi:hypothetical protein NBRC116494_27540 [Aurantivibrio plasticivorans]